ncbi:phospholipase D-like domain-containing protein [Scytonema sp. NUACC21]
MKQLSLFHEYEQSAVTSTNSVRKSDRALQPLTLRAIDLVQLHDEMEAIASPLQKQIQDLALRLDSLEKYTNNCFADINHLLKAIEPYSYELVFDRSGSRAILIEALQKAQNFLILVCPWLTPVGMPDWVIQQLEILLKKDVLVQIGWGRSDDLKQGKTDDTFWYGALPRLLKLQDKYPEKFHLKALGTHEKFLVYDDVAFLGSHNLLTSGKYSNEREVGLLTTDPRIVQGLIKRFNQPLNLEHQRTYLNRY